MAVVPPDKLDFYVRRGNSWLGSSMQTTSPASTSCSLFVQNPVGSGKVLYVYLLEVWSDSPGQVAYLGDGVTSGGSLVTAQNSSFVHSADSPSALVKAGVGVLSGGVVVLTKRLVATTPVEVISPVLLGPGQQLAARYDGPAISAQVWFNVDWWEE